MWVYFWAFCFVPLICVSVLCQYHTDLRTIALQYSLEPGHIWLQLFCFLSQDCFDYLGSFMIPYEFYNCSIPIKKSHWNFDRNFTESVDCLNSTDILTILIHLIHEHRKSFHFFCLLKFSSLMCGTFQCTCLSHLW